MFKKIIIQDQLLIDFFVRDLKKRQIIKVKGFEYEVQRKQNMVLIRSMKGMTLNPKRDFMDGKIILTQKKEERIIEIGVSKFIERLYLALGVGIFLFCILSLFKNFIIGLILIIVFGAVFWYNYKKINSAIVDYEMQLKA